MSTDWRHEIDPADYRRERNKYAIPAAILALVLVGGVVAFIIRVAHNRPSNTDIGSVRISVTGSVSGPVTITDAEGPNTRTLDVTVPWTYSYTVSGFQVLRVNAQASGPGTLTCSMSFNGTVIDTRTSTGTDPSVACAMQTKEIFTTTTP